MSLKSWKAEFYPIDACKCPKKDALDHSLRKWEGLTSKNLKRHGLDVHETVIHESGNFAGPQLFIDDSSCALCVWYASSEDGGDYCAKCPLPAVRDGYACDSRILSREHQAPYQAFSIDGDIRPMLALLRKAKAVQNKKEKPE